MLATWGSRVRTRAREANTWYCPPGYKGAVPKGYFIVRPKTYGVWVLLRGSIAKGIAVAVRNVKDHLKIYPLAKKDNPPKMEFISGSGLAFNTIHTNDFTFYEHLNELIQYEPLEMLDPETRGLLASIGIVKGKPFNPDARMKRLLTDAVAIGNAAARSIVWYPRMKDAKIYQDTDSAWIMGYAGKDVFFLRNAARNLDARVLFHYFATGVTPAMAVTRPGLGSDYAAIFLDSKKLPFDGSKTYKLHLPPNVPAKDFWAVTIYDTQTRSMLQTDQAFPSVGSQSKGIKKNADGSYDLYFGPKPPKGREGNWVQTIPGKSWFIILRLYGPLQPWIDQSWRPGEIEMMK